jgi:group II intron reverse transcriptase/maturase
MFIERKKEGMRMQKAENILRAIRKLGVNKHPLTNVYRNLYCEELYLLAYDRLAKNQGSLTRGISPDTIDGMNQERIRKIITALRYERYNFQPVRREYIPKSNGGKRPLGIPSFSDKLVQEAVRLIIEAYYEPQFSQYSHGFRPMRGCHTALAYIKRGFTGTVWYIEGDIQGCFDAIDHERLLSILRTSIPDGRFVNLIRRMLKAGYLENWRYHKTHSGVPQGGVISPILSNVYLNQLDQFYEQVLAPKHNKGRSRKKSKTYRKMQWQREKAYRSDDLETVRRWQKQLLQIPAADTQDPDFRRLKYVRYADDFLLGYIGSKAEAKQIQDELRTFLHQELGLTLSQEKTLITHARTGKASFLGYTINTYHENSKITRNANGHKQRSINGIQRLGVPIERIDKYCRPYLRRGKAHHRSELLHSSVPAIIWSYQVKFRGIAEYYKYANNRAALSKLKYVMETSLVKTLAHKLKTSVRKVYRKYRATKTINGKSYSVLLATVETNGKTNEYFWGGIPLNVEPVGKAYIEDRILPPIQLSTTDLIQRLEAGTCEYCGAREQIEVHHVRKLANLKKRWQGRKDKPLWVVQMIARRRKTLILCRACHQKLHQGKLDT